MAKRLKINDASAQLKDFLRQLDVKKGEYVLEVTGEPLVGIIPLWQVESSPKGEKRSSLFLKQSWKPNCIVGEAEIKQSVKEAIDEIRVRSMEADIPITTIC